jgi:hypothetical protein
VIIGEQLLSSRWILYHYKSELQRKILSPRRGSGKPPEKNLSLLSGQGYTFGGDLKISRKWTEVGAWNSAIIQAPVNITEPCKFRRQIWRIGQQKKITKSVKFQVGNYLLFVGERKKVFFVTNECKLRKLFEKYLGHIIHQNSKIVHVTDVIPEIPIHIMVRGRGGSDEKPVSFDTMIQERLPTAEELREMTVGYFEKWYVEVWKRWRIFNNVKENFDPPEDEDEFHDIRKLAKK